ncbi:hypothetical protein BASA50_010714 [Batrachochytrium salamandrivorans]|uniref:J domain-containing protein n=1 Tax=Batrachochytrium salamandrivorans TaxID=1357716 RepID=A0ABQ8EYU9_9FUNG|nr:hypothetical protein BASA50_010714 [Batrachochytrium salamandrivorans]KAH6595870.1 hypothetical protein BASA61_003664 [Batrachochytrium salamandrivorans]
MNTDESLRCLDISKRKFSVGETAAALKFANKAISLCDSQEAQAWLKFITTQASTTAASENNTPKSSSAPTGPSLRSRKSSAAMNNDTPPSEEESTRLYTDAQVKGIKRIRAVKAKGDLYGILGLEKGCTESDIKKAYRKLALQFHPDKCGAPGTDEAFKAISHAFTVLGDADKKEHYDRYGVDMDTRAGAAAAASSRGGFRGFDGARFESELSPEDLFRMFMGGSEFPRFGGNGFRTFSTHNQARQRQAHQQHRQQQAGSGEGASTLIQLVQMLPVLFLGLFTLASLLSSSQPDPFSFTQTRDYTDGRVSTQHKVPYYVNRDVFRTSWASSDAQVKILEAKVESTYLAGLERGCASEQENQRFQIAQAYGLFGVNQKILKRAQGMRLPNCQRLERWYNEATTD